MQSSGCHVRPWRIQLRTVNFADAHVEAWHEAPSDPNSTSGGAFFSEGSFTLTRSRLTVPWIVFKFRICLALSVRVFSWNCINGRGLMDDFGVSCWMMAVDTKLGRCRYPSDNRRRWEMFRLLLWMVVASQRTETWPWVALQGHRCLFDSVYLLRKKTC